MAIRLIIVAIFVVLLQGCASPYNKFYFDKTGGKDVKTWQIVDLTPKEPKVFRGNNPDEDYQNMLENGYLMVGYSSFNAGDVNQNGALSQAKVVHAATVILYSKYTNTISGTLPLTLPNTTRSTTTLSGNVYGSGGYANYSGTLNTTNYGTKTTYIPYSVTRSDYLATYWVKLKSATFGVHFRVPTNSERKRIGSNKGLIVNAVVNGSPAFMMDIFKDDVIQRIGGVDLYTFGDYQNALRKYSNKKTNVVVLRNGKTIEKEIELSSIHSRQ